MTSANNSSRVKTLVVPIFRHYWLWNAWVEKEALEGSEKWIRDWRSGRNLEEKMHLMQQQLVGWLNKRLRTEWKKLEESKTGSLKNRIYRLAQAVLSREDPQESFLKTVPLDGGYLDVVYPDEYPETLIRRRLRLMARQAKAKHRSRMLLWWLVLLPQLPLMLTPLPNITVYYTAYRVWSHSRALQGSNILDKGFSSLDSKQLEDLRERLMQIQEEQGVEYPEGSWPYKLIRKEKTYLDIFEKLVTLHKKRKLEKRLVIDSEGSIPSAKSIVDPENTSRNELFVPVESEEKQMEEEEQKDELLHDHEIFDTGMHLVFHADTKLSEITKPTDRWKRPLGDKAAIHLGELFKAPHILENIARARKRTVGSFFPSDSREW